MSGNFAAVQYSHRSRVGVELQATAPVVQYALRDIVRDNVKADAFAYQ